MDENGFFTIIWCVFIIMVLGTFWVVAATQITWTFEFDMDEETRDYLVQHHYCMYHSQNGTVTNTFFGECSYLDKTLQWGMVP